MLDNSLHTASTHLKANLHPCLFGNDKQGWRCGLMAERPDLSRYIHSHNQATSVASPAKSVLFHVSVQRNKVFIYKKHRNQETDCDGFTKPTKPKQPFFNQWTIR